jgi:hypothetical protein
VPVNAAGRGDDPAMDAWTAPDRLQADYYRSLLNERCAEIDRRIAKYQTLLTRHQAGGNDDEIRRLRRMIRIEDHERQTLNRLLKALNRRFGRPRKPQPVQAV